MNTYTSLVRLDTDGRYNNFESNMINYLFFDKMSWSKVIGIILFSDL